MKQVTRYRTHSNKEVYDALEGVIDGVKEILDAIEPCEHKDVFVEIIERFREDWSKK